MSNGKKRTGLFGITGIIVAMLIIAVFVVGGNIFEAKGKGTLTIQIMDKPVELATLNMTIDWVRIQDENGSRIDLALKTEEPFYFDLLKLKDGVSETLSETEIPAGNYTMIQMHVLTANATDIEGNEMDLNVPSDIIKVLLQPALDMKDGGKMTVLIDLQPDENSIAISHSLNIRPVIKATVLS